MGRFRTVAAAMYRVSLLGGLLAVLAASPAAAQSAAESAADVELRLRRAANAMVAAEEESARLEKRLATERSRVVETEVERDLNRETILRLEHDLSSAKAREGEVRKLLEALQSERRARQHGAKPAPPPPRSVEPGHDYYRSVASQLQTLPTWLWAAVGSSIAGAVMLYARRRRLAGGRPADPVTTLPQRRSARWVLIGGGALLAVTIGIGWLAWLDHLERSREEAERLRMTPLLEQAGHDDVRLRDLKQSCHLACPPDIVGAIDARLRINETESASVREAQNSIEKLQEYVRDCKACNLRKEAVARIEELAREARAKEIERFEQSFASAGQDEALLRSFIDACKEPCPESLRARAQARFDVIRQARERELSRLREQERYRNARGSLALLRSYVISCTLCEHGGAARSEIADLEREETRMREAQTYRSARGNLGALNLYMNGCSVCEFRSAAREEAAKLSREEKFFALRICNRTKQSLSVAIAGTRDPDSSQFRIEGWWIVSAGDCKTIGRWVKGKVYFHASAQGGTWGKGELKFCIASEVYDRVNTTNYTCKGNEKLREFGERTVSASEHTINFDP